jgi:hypothetical protein
MTAAKTEAIRALNDRFRHNLSGSQGTAVITTGVAPPSPPVSFTSLELRVFEQVLFDPPEFLLGRHSKYLLLTRTDHGHEFDR